MPKARQGRPRTDATTARDAGQVPPRRRGGQELPDAWQDRPEQNAGYDEAVHAGPAGTPQDPLMELDNDLRREDPYAEGGPLAAVPTDEPLDPELAEEIDEREEGRAAAEVRRREKSSR